MTTDIHHERAERRRQVVQGYRLFASLGWGDLGDGHITARDPERTDCMWLLRGGVPFNAATDDDLVLIGPDGEVLEGRGPYNRTAYNIHWPIHEARPDIVGVAHTHTAYGTPFATTRKLLRPITQEACVFFGDHSVFDDEEVQVRSIDGGKRIAAALGPHRAVILANHGLLTTGPSVGLAVAAFVTMDRVAEAHIKAPDAMPISDAAAAEARADLGPERSLAAGFHYLVATRLGDA